MAFEICRGWMLAGQTGRLKLARVRPRTKGEFKGALGRRFPGLSWPRPARHDGRWLRCGVREAVGLELIAQRSLQDFSRRGVRNALDEHDVIGHPPFGDLAVHVFDDLLPA